MSETSEIRSRRNAANGYCGLDASGYVAAAQMPALTGDVTTSAGGVATVIGAGVVTQAMLALDEQHPSLIAGSAYELADFYDSGTRILLTAGPALTANRVYFFPFKYKGASSITITAFEAKVTTAVAASNFRMGIYGTSAGLPSGAALVDTGNMSGAATGYVSSGAVSLALSAGKYWMAVHVSAAIGFNGYNGGCVPTVGGTFADDNIYNGYIMTNSYGSLPTPSSLTRVSISAPPRFKIQI